MQFGLAWTRGNGARPQPGGAGRRPLTTALNDSGRGLRELPCEVVSAAIGPRGVVGVAGVAGVTGVSRVEDAR